MTTIDPTADLRAHLARALEWHDAHVDFDTAIAGLPADLRGRRPERLPYSAWQLVEHLRIAQHDILEFCRNPNYVELAWPDDYWPAAEAPPTRDAWDQAVGAVRHDRDELKRLALDPQVDLFARIPHGTGQTYARELLLVVDHNAYHVGELIAVRRLLSAWK